MPCICGDSLSIFTPILFKVFMGWGSRFWAAVRHGLDAVDGEKRLAFARIHGHTVLVVETAELATVFIQIVMAGGKAT